MAQGSIIWRCRTCGNKAAGTCKHPKAAYAIVYRVGKRQKWEAVGRSKKVAERRLVEVLGQLHNGTYRQLVSITFSELAEKWLSDYAAVSVKPSTLRRYRSLIVTHLRPRFGSLPLTEVTTELMDRYKAYALRERRLAPRTVNQSLAVLKVMLRCGKQWGYLRENPAQEVRLVRVESAEMDYLRPDEVRLLLRCADEPYRTLFLTAVLTGMRRSELLALQWGDIDWQNHVLHVRRGLFWHTEAELSGANGCQGPLWRFVTPKSKRSVRRIVLSPKLQEALELYRLTCPVSPQDLVFCTPGGGPMDPDNMVKREFLPALSRAGLRRVRFHDLRHTYTALLIAQGAHAKFIQSQLGHASITTTLDRYGHLLPEAQQGTGERLDAMVFNPASTEKVAESVPVMVISETSPLS